MDYLPLKREVWRVNGHLMAIIHSKDIKLLSSRDPDLLTEWMMMPSLTLIEEATTSTFRFEALLSLALTVHPFSWLIRFIILHFVRPRKLQFLLSDTSVHWCFCRDFQAGIHGGTKGRVEGIRGGEKLRWLWALFSNKSNSDFISYKLYLYIKFPLKTEFWY